VIFLVDHDADRALDEERGAGAGPGFAVQPASSLETRWRLVQELPVSPLHLVEPERDAAPHTVARRHGFLHPRENRGPSPSRAR